MTYKEYIENLESAAYARTEFEYQFGSMEKLDNELEELRKHDPTLADMTKELVAAGLKVADYANNRLKELNKENN